jgi:hypothetical protein
MNDFVCKCSKCNVSRYYLNIKKAFLDGWQFGNKALCWECQKLAKSAPAPKDNDPEVLENFVLSN